MIPAIPFSRATTTVTGTYGTELRQRYNTTERQNGETATEKRKHGNGKVETGHYF